MSPSDQLLLALIVGVPSMGALFALAMPGVDRIALRQVGMGVSIAGGLCGLEACRRIAVAALAGDAAGLSADVAGVRIGLDALSGVVLLSLSFVVPLALRAGAPRVMDRTQFYVVSVLFAQGTLAAAILIEAPIVRIGVASLTSVPLFCLVALFGGPQRGTTTYRAALIWLVADLVALSVLVWLAAAADVSTRDASVGALARACRNMGGAQPWIALALCAPGFVRLAAGPFSVWLQSFLDEAPVSAASIAAAGVMPFGALLVGELAVPVASAGARAIAAPAAVVCAAAALLAGVIALAERDLRRLLAQMMFLVGATAAPALLAFEASALAYAVVHVVVAGAAAAAFLVATEAIERRFETRDATALVGLSVTAPILAAVAALGLASLTGVPGVGAGNTLWGVLHGLVVAPALTEAPTAIVALTPVVAIWIAIAIGGAHALAATGAAGVLRRLFSPPTARQKKEPIRVSPGQAVRLLIPALWALAIGLAAPALVRTAVPAAKAHIRPAAVRAELDTTPALPFARRAGPARVAPADAPADADTASPATDAPLQEGAP